MVLGFWLIACETEFHTIGGVDTEGPTVSETDVGDTDDTNTDIDTATEIRPTALCALLSTGSVFLGSSVTVDGLSSIDGLGGELTHDWTLEAPDGSEATLSDSTAAVTTFVPDVAGTYTATLVVTADGARTSDPCSLSVLATPLPALDVTITWTLTGDDMDLHLLAPEGILNTTSDCNYANRNPDWGPSGSEGDPTLAADDIAGTGPEQIYIISPEAGTFTLVVHDWRNGDETVSAPDDVTMTVRSQGDEVWSGTRTITGEDTYTTFATVTFPGATVTPAP